MVAARAPCDAGHPMTVELVMLVARGEDDRLSGFMRRAEGGDARRTSPARFELMRVFEELVPVGGDAREPDRTPTRATRRSGGPFRDISRDRPIARIRL